MSIFDLQNREQNSIYPLDDTTLSKIKNIGINNKEKFNNQFLILNNSLNVTLRQVITLIDKTSCYKNNIEYKVFNEKIYILNCKEETTYCQRKFCNYYYRNLKFRLILSNEEKLGYFRKLHDKSFFFPKPHIIIKYYLGEKLYIIKEFYKLYESNYFIYDKNNKLIYFLKIPYYQWRFFCCRNSFFCKNKIIIGHLYEKGKLSIKNILIGKRVNDGKYNHLIFNIIFPINMNIYDKFNIIICSILFHYKYFSIKESKRYYVCKCIIKISLFCFIIVFLILLLIFYFSKKSYQ